MSRIKIESILAPYLRQSLGKYPGFIFDFLIWLIGKIVYPKKVKDLYLKIQDKKGINFIEELFDNLNFTYVYSEKDYRKIPFEGRLIVVVNHPLGGLDALSVLSLIYSLRTDVKIIVSEILMNIDNINEFFIPLNSSTWMPDEETMNEVSKSMKREEVIIFFPAGAVSRTKYFQIKDKSWNADLIKGARRFNAPILPVFINSKNSIFFYILSSISKNISMLFLPRETLKKRSKSIKITIGNPIPASAFRSDNISDKSYSKLLQSHDYRIGKGKKGIFKEEMTIIHPIEKRLLKKEISECDLLSSQQGGDLYIAEYSKAPNVIKEISRLREITFRKVGEGTGRKNDIDVYDLYYYHLVLWNPAESEIIGSYRFGIVSEIIRDKGIRGIYNAELFTFDEEFFPVLNASMELGRSFIQQKYWRTMSLDIMWQGIGLFLQKHPDIRYLFGPVSISNNYNDFSKAAIVTYYKKWYSTENALVNGRNKYEISGMLKEEVSHIFNGENHLEDFRLLKTALKNFGLTVPVLFRQYTELCDFGGVQFLEFNIDSGFANCIDGFMLLDLNFLKESKISRYRKEQSAK